MLKTIAALLLLTCSVNSALVRTPDCEIQCAKCVNVLPESCEAGTKFLAKGDECGCCNVCIGLSDIGEVCNDTRTCKPQLHCLSGKCVKGNCNPMLSRCDSNGSYKPVQCSSTQCWCVDPALGNNLPNTTVPIPSDTKNIVSCSSLLEAKTDAPPETINATAKPLEETDNHQSAQKYQLLQAIEYLISSWELCKKFQMSHEVMEATIKHTVLHLCPILMELKKDATCAESITNLKKILCGLVPGTCNNNSLDDVNSKNSHEPETESFKVKMDNACDKFKKMSYLQNIKTSLKTYSQLYGGKQPKSSIHNCAEKSHRRFLLYILPKSFKTIRNSNNSNQIQATSAGHEKYQSPSKVYKCSHTYYTSLHLFPFISMQNKNSPILPSSDSIINIPNKLNTAYNHAQICPHHKQWLNALKQTVDQKATKVQVKLQIKNKSDMAPNVKLSVSNNETVDAPNNKSDVANNDIQSQNFNPGSNNENSSNPDDTQHLQNKTNYENTDSDEANVSTNTRTETNDVANDMAQFSEEELYGDETKNIFERVKIGEKDSQNKEVKSIIRPDQLYNKTQHTDKTVILIEDEPTDIMNKITQLRRGGLISHEINRTHILNKRQYSEMKPQAIVKHTSETQLNNNDLHEIKNKVHHPRPRTLEQIPLFKQLNKEILNAEEPETSEDIYNDYGNLQLQLNDKLPRIIEDIRNYDHSEQKTAKVHGSKRMTNTPTESLKNNEGSSKLQVVQKPSYEHKRNVIVTKERNGYEDQDSKTNKQTLANNNVVDVAKQQLKNAAEAKLPEKYKAQDTLYTDESITDQGTPAGNTSEKQTSNKNITNCAEQSDKEISASHNCKLQLHKARRNVNMNDKTGVQKTIQQSAETNNCSRNVRDCGVNDKTEVDGAHVPKSEGSLIKQKSTNDIGKIQSPINSRTKREDTPQDTHTIDETQTKHACCKTSQNMHKNITAIQKEISQKPIADSSDNVHSGTEKINSLQHNEQKLPADNHDVQESRVVWKRTRMDKNNTNSNAHNTSKNNRITHRNSKNNKITHHSHNSAHRNAKNSKNAHRNAKNKKITHSSNTNAHSNARHNSNTNAHNKSSNNETTNNNLKSSTNNSNFKKNKNPNIIAYNRSQHTEGKISTMQLTPYGSTHQLIPPNIALKNKNSNTSDKTDSNGSKVDKNDKLRTQLAIKQNNGVVKTGNNNGSTLIKSKVVDKNEKMRTQLAIKEKNGGVKIDNSTSLNRTNFSYKRINKRELTGNWFSEYQGSLGKSSHKLSHSYFPPTEFSESNRHLKDDKSSEILKSEPKVLQPENTNEESSQIKTGNPITAGSSNREQMAAIMNTHIPNAYNIIRSRVSDIDLTNDNAKEIYHKLENDKTSRILKSDTKIMQPKDIKEKLSELEMTDSIAQESNKQDILSESLDFLLPIEKLILNGMFDNIMQKRSATFREEAAETKPEPKQDTQNQNIHNLSTSDLLSNEIHQSVIINDQTTNESGKVATKAAPLAESSNNKNIITNGESLEAEHYSAQSLPKKEYGQITMITDVASTNNDTNIKTITKRDTKNQDSSESQIIPGKGLSNTFISNSSEPVHETHQTLNGDRYEENAQHYVEDQIPEGSNTDEDLLDMWWPIKKFLLTQIHKNHIVKRDVHNSSKTKETGNKHNSQASRNQRPSKRVHIDTNQRSNKRTHNLYNSGSLIAGSNDTNQKVKKHEAKPTSNIKTTTTTTTTPSTTTMKPKSVKNEKAQLKSEQPNVKVSQHKGTLNVVKFRPYFRNKALTSKKNSSKIIHNSHPLRKFSGTIHKMNGSESNKSSGITETVQAAQSSHNDNAEHTRKRRQLGFIGDKTDNEVISDTEREQILKSKPGSDKLIHAEEQGKKTFFKTGKLKAFRPETNIQELIQTEQIMSIPEAKHFIQAGKTNSLRPKTGFEQFIHTEQITDTKRVNPIEKTKSNSHLEKSYDKNNINVAKNETESHNINEDSAVELDQLLRYFGMRNESVEHIAGILNMSTNMLATVFQDPSSMHNNNAENSNNSQEVFNILLTKDNNISYFVEDANKSNQEDKVNETAQEMDIEQIIPKIEKSPNDNLNITEIEQIIHKMEKSPNDTLNTTGMPTGKRNITIVDREFINISIEVTSLKPLLEDISVGEEDETVSSFKVTPSEVTTPKPKETTGIMGRIRAFISESFTYIVNVARNVGKFFSRTFGW